MHTQTDHSATSIRTYSTPEGFSFPYFNQFLLEKLEMDQWKSQRNRPDGHSVVSASLTSYPEGGAVRKSHWVSKRKWIQPMRNMNTLSGKIIKPLCLLCIIYSTAHIRNFYEICETLLWVWKESVSVGQRGQQHLFSYSTCSAWHERWPRSAPSSLAQKPSSCTPVPHVRRCVWGWERGGGGGGGCWKWLIVINNLAKYLYVNSRRCLDTVEL